MRLGEKCPGIRQCCGCEASVSSNAKIIKPSDPSILTLSILVYRRTKAGRQLGAARKSVYLCESCLRSILGYEQGTNEKTLSLGAAVVTAVEPRYNAMCEAK